MANKAIKGKIGNDTVYFVPYFPVGSIYITVSETNPSTIFGGTWEKIEGKFLLGANTTYKVESTGGATSHTHTNPTTGSTTLTSSHIPQHSHSVGAHSHGLNSHTHSVGAHHHGLNSHTHGAGSLSAAAAGAHSHLLAFNVNSGEHWSGNRDYASYGGYGAYPKGTYYSDTKACDSHTHSVNGTTGAASGNTANSTAFNTGAASGSTANSTAFNTGNWGTASPSGHTHTVGNTGSSSNLPPYIAVYIWKRTA